MSDLVVTVPKELWSMWIGEGDAAGDAETGEEWGFYVFARPPIEPGERLYIVAWGLVRGYAPVTAVRGSKKSYRYAICRRGGAIAVTIDEPIKGFRGYRRTWWLPGAERPFPDWKTAGMG